MSSRASCSNEEVRRLFIAKAAPLFVLARIAKLS